ncbi:histidine phosphatase family protein [Undibacterium amnicola]|jgi:phosphohistidine phosphatase SixA|uniref:Histidine phosphatase family protein n=1 Tax=Undibacterium amnicola TaxID=1834038 RepID=A0ABR6XQM5_9BURK|nr:histidine phosphatase family protein [Undibacterium amnicola]MBC3831793.1 histidine phosphatase family protein [Undibacterium amnicola]
MKKIYLAACIVLSTLSTQAWSFQTIFIVRHGEKVDESRDPLLSAQGKNRAMNLANILRDADVKRIYVTEFQRTQMTAAPLAEARQLSLTPYAAKESRSLANQLSATDSNALVVGHSNTLIDILQGLGVHTAKNVADDEYDRLIVVHLNKNAAPTYTVLRY